MLKINRVKEAFHSEGIQISTKALNVLSDEAKGEILEWVRIAKEDEDVHRVTPEFLMRHPSHIPTSELEKAESLLKSIPQYGSHHQINEKIQTYFDAKVNYTDDSLTVSLEEQELFDQIAYNYLMNNYYKGDNGLYYTATVEEFVEYTDVNFETNADGTDRGFFNPLTEKYQDEMPEQPTWIIDIQYGRQDDCYNETYSLKVGVVKTVLDKFLEAKRQKSNPIEPSNRRLCHWIQDVEW